MGNHSSSSESIYLEDIERELSLLVETKLMPDFSHVVIEQKSKLLQIFHNIINSQKESFLQNCQKIDKSIDEQFHRVVLLLRARQRVLKNKFFNEVKEKLDAWDRQLSSCETILAWLKEINVTTNEVNFHAVREMLNTKFAEDFECIDSSDVQFNIGHETINNSTVTLLKPLENLGKIAYNRELKLLAPKFIIGSTGNGDGQFCRPWGVCTDSSGHIFISDRSNHRIQIFNELGEFVLQFGKEGSQPGELYRPAGIAVNKKNEIIVCDKDNHRIQIFTFCGRLITKFGSEGTEAGQFFYPWGVAINSMSEIAISDSKNSRIQLFDEFGNFLNIFDSTKFNIDRPQAWLKILDSPRGLAFRPDGSLLVTDFNNHRILIISKNLNRYRIFGSEGSGPGKFSRPQGIACDMLGRFAVADCKNYRVQVFDANNRVTKIFGRKGDGPSRFDNPQGISFHPNGSIVVVDFNNDRVQVF